LHGVEVEPEGVAHEGEAQRPGLAAGEPSGGVGLNTPAGRVAAVPAPSHGSRRVQVDERLLDDGAQEALLGRPRAAAVLLHRHDVCGAHLDPDLSGETGPTGCGSHAPSGSKDDAASVDRGNSSASHG
jgi:hypothetical protein